MARSFAPLIMTVLVSAACDPPTTGAPGPASESPRPRDLGRGTAPVAHDDDAGVAADSGEGEAAADAASSADGGPLLGDIVWDDATYGYGFDHDASRGIGHGDGGGPHASPTVRESATSVSSASGKPSSDVIRRVVRQNLGAIRRCYVDGLARDPKLAGDLTVAFVINRRGEVASARKSKGSLGDAAVTRCALAAFGPMSFPPQESAPVSVAYSLTFSPE